MPTPWVSSLVHRSLDRLCTAFSLLVLPLATLLLLQWPLRDVLGAYSRQANDMAQWVFALYVAVALRHTTRQGRHLAATAVSTRYSEAWRRRLARWGHALAVLPFAIYVLVSGALMVWRALQATEAFPDTGNPGYFIVKLSAWLMALLMALQALADLGTPRAGTP